MNQPPGSPVAERYQGALDDLVARLRRDPYVVAALLLGSLAHDVVWERSDIDLLLCLQEVRLKAPGLTLTERGVSIHTTLVTRSAFRGMLEGSLQGAFTHSLLSKGRLLFTSDETLATLFEEARAHLGSRDRQIALLRAGSEVLGAVAKAEKWLRTRQDGRYSFYWIMKGLDELAAIEVLLHGEVVEREVIQQALRHNPAFFGSLYVELVDGPKSTQAAEAALARIWAYLRGHAPVLFAPLLRFLGEAGGPRSGSEIDHHFRQEFGTPGPEAACEYLADLDVLAKVAVPVRLTERSRVDAQEAAYYYEGDAPR